MVNNRLQNVSPTNKNFKGGRHYIIYTIQVIMNLIYFLQRANLEQWFHDSSQRENDDEVSVTEALLLNAYFWGLQGRDAVWGQPKRSQMLQGNRTTLQQFLKIMPGMKRPYSQYALLSTCRIRIISEAGRRCFSGACRLWRVLPAQRAPSLIATNGHSNVSNARTLRPTPVLTASTQPSSSSSSLSASWWYFENKREEVINMLPEVFYCCNCSPEYPEAK